MRAFNLLLPTVVAATFCYGIASGGRLSPDTACFARGACAWSSPLQAAAGDLFGSAGVAAVAVGGTVALFIVVWQSGDGAAGASVLALGPWAAALACAGADAAGTVVVLAAWLLGRRRGGVLACACHLANGLVCLAALGGERVRIPYPVGLALAAIAEMAVLHANLGGSSEPTQWQWRYLLPAVAVGTPALLNRLRRRDRKQGARDGGPDAESERLSGPDDKEVTLADATA